MSPQPPEEPTTPEAAEPLQKPAPPPTAPDHQAHPNEDSDAVQRIHASVMREQDEPRDGHERVPVILFVGILALCMWGGWYLSEFDASFEPHVYDGPDAVVVTAGGGAAAEPVAIDPMLAGKRVYNNCISCHQSDGRGVANQYPPLAGSEWVLGDEQTLGRILLHGVNGPMTVSGNLYNAQMPGWGIFSDADIAAVLTYIRASWGNDAPAVDPAVIKAVRDATPGRTSAWSEAELLAAGPVEVQAAGADADADASGEPADAELDEPIAPANSGGGA